MSRIITFCSIIGLFIFNGVDAQYSSKKVRSKHEAYTDSLRQVKYDYVFPIYGQKVYQRGFDIPFPAGVMVNAMWVKQGLIIDNLRLGLLTDGLDIPLTPVDFVQFGENTSTAYTTIFRPDLWIFPFLNVYGLFGYGHSTTDVNVVSPVEFNSIVDQNISTFGFGLTGAGGVGPVWIALDFNLSWTKPELVEDPVKVNTFGVRVGHTFAFGEKPYRNVALWAGGMRASIGAETIGDITLRDALPDNVWNRRDQFVDEYWDWYNSLNPQNPADRLKMDKADLILSPIIENLSEANGSAVVRYGIDKQIAEEWNGIIGIQYQHNKRWIFRSEAGIIGDRKSIMLSINYRFLL